jgi:hypothetical protein
MRRTALRNLNVRHGLYREIERLVGGRVRGAQCQDGWSAAIIAGRVWRWALRRPIQSRRFSVVLDARGTDSLCCARNDGDVFRDLATWFLPRFASSFASQGRGAGKTARAAPASDEGGLPDGQSHKILQHQRNQVAPLLTGFTPTTSAGHLKLFLLCLAQAGCFSSLSGVFQWTAFSLVTFNSFFMMTRIPAGFCDRLAPFGIQSIATDAVEVMITIEKRAKRFAVRIRALPPRRCCRLHRSESGIGPSTGDDGPGRR